MRRREFIALVTGAAAWPLMARAQQPMPVIGWLGSMALNGFEKSLSAFHQGLSEAGFSEGRNVTIEYRWAENRHDRLPALAADLVRRPVTLIVAAGGEPPAVAAKAATSTIPVVFSATDDPVRLGLVASFNRPGGNMTGMSIFNAVVNTKRLQVLHELLPHNKAVGLIVSATIPDIDNQVADAQAAARALGISFHILNADDDAGFDNAFASAARLRIGALMVHPTAFVMNRRVPLVAAAGRYAIPAIYPGRPFVVAGGLISYGIDFQDIYRQAGRYSGRILKGEKPGDLPVQQPTTFELAINLKTARALGLEIPPTLLARADEVIE